MMHPTPKPAGELCIGDTILLKGERTIVAIDHTIIECVDDDGTEHVEIVNLTFDDGTDRLFSCSTQLLVVRLAPTVDIADAMCVLSIAGDGSNISDALLWRALDEWAEQ